MKVMLTKRITSALAAITAVTLPLSANQILVNDSFADNNRTTQNLPDSMAWFTGAASSSLSVSDNAMDFETAGSGRTILAYFGTNAAGTTPVSLAVGEELNIKFTFSVSGTVFDDTNSLRMGVFDSSGGSQVSADSFGNSNAAFNGYEGYGVFTNPGGTSGALRIYERTTPENNALLSTVGNFTMMGSTETVDNPFAVDTTYTAEWDFTRSAVDQMDIDFTLTGGSIGTYTISRSDTSGITHTFDTIAIGSISAQLLDYTFDSFEITLIPEPGTLILVAMSLVCIGVLRKRR